MTQFAVIKTGGKQYKIKEGDVLKIDKIVGKTGDSAVFDQVLLITDLDGQNIKIGKPTIAGAKVETKILEQGRGKKILIGKYKAKVRYRRKIGFRPMFTKVEIKKISVSG